MGHQGESTSAKAEMGYQNEPTSARGRNGAGKTRSNYAVRLDVGGFADLGGEFVNFALKDVADGEDSDKTAIIFNHGEVADLVVDHDGGGFSDRSGAGREQDRGGHDFRDGELVGIAS